MKGIYLIAFLASWTVITASKLPNIFEAENVCPAVDTCPPKLISHKDCTKYYECKNGQKQVRSCAANLYFSKSWGGCVRQEISDCPITPTPTTEYEGCPAVDTCPPKLISHEDCTKYYECKNSQRQLRSCAANLYFSKSWGGCVRQEISDCPITPTPTTEGCPAVDTCPPKLINHEDCTKFYECKNGQRQLRLCAANLYFSKSWGGCVSRESSDCPYVPTLPPPTRTTQKSGGCTHGELLPHECKCLKYYECKNGRKALRDCPTGQHFNKYTKTCEPGTDCNNPTKPTEPTPTKPTPTKPTPTKPTKPTPTKPIPTKPTKPTPRCIEGENIAHECKCTKYYVCKGDRKALRECNKGMHFDKTSKMCVPGEDC